MALVDDLIPTAIQLIQEFGSEVKLKKPSSSNYNVATGMVETVDGTETIYKADISSYELQELGGAIVGGDLKILMANENQVFSQSNDKIIFNNEEFDIINIKPMYLQNKIMMYELQVR